MPKSKIRFSDHSELREAHSVLATAVPAEGEIPEDGLVVVEMRLEPDPQSRKGKTTVIYLFPDDVRKIEAARLELDRQRQKRATDRICSRSACQRKGARFYNSSTEMYYCWNCAHKINQQNQGVCSTVVRTYVEWEDLIGQDDQEELRRGAPGPANRPLRSSENK